MPEFDLDAALTVPEPVDEWVHVGGDRNGWEYGAKWYNAFSQHMMACEGIEDQPILWANDIEVPEDVLARITDEAKTRYPDPEDADMVATQVDHKTEEWQEAERERQEAARTQEVHLWLCDEHANDYHIEGVLRNLGIEQEDWDSFDLPDKWTCIADYHGLYEMDSVPMRLTHAKLQARLGTAKLR